MIRSYDHTRGPLAVNAKCHLRAGLAPDRRREALYPDMQAGNCVCILAERLLQHPRVFLGRSSKSSGIYRLTFPKEVGFSRKAGCISGRSYFATRSAMATPNDELEVFGKAATGTGSPSNERGDCPFSQRIYMALEEKNLPYKATYVEEGPDKPDWFMQNNPSGLMPVLRDGPYWIQDSDKIFEHLEKKFPDPSLKTPEEFKSVGANIFQAFTKWLKSMDRSDPSRQEFANELSAFNDHLKKHGPYIAGDKPTDSDFALAPKLRHARVALKHFMEFEIPNNLDAVKKYIELMESRPSFKKTDSPDEMIVSGWQMKFDLPDKVEKDSAHEKRTSIV